MEYSNTCTTCKKHCEDKAILEQSRFYFFFAHNLRFHILIIRALITMNSNSLPNSYSSAFPETFVEVFSEKLKHLNIIKDPFLSLLLSAFETEMCLSVHNSFENVFYTRNGEKMVPLLSGVAERRKEYAAICGVVHNFSVSQQLKFCRDFGEIGLIWKRDSVDQQSEHVTNMLEFTGLQPINTSVVLLSVISPRNEGYVPRVAIAELPIVISNIELFTT